MTATIHVCRSWQDRDPVRRQLGDGGSTELMAAITARPRDLPGGAGIQVVPRALQQPKIKGFPHVLVGYMRMSSADDRQSVDLQRDALLSAGVDKRHLHHDKASGARDDRPGLKVCLDELRQGDVLVVWKLDRLDRSLPHLLAIVNDLKRGGVAFRSLTEQMDTTTPHGELLFGIFGSLAQYERALTRERVIAGLAAARQRDRKGGRPLAIEPERMEQIVAALDGGASQASVCRSFKVPRSTLLDTLVRIGWTRPTDLAESGELAVRGKKGFIAKVA